MKKIYLLSLLACSLAFASCQKAEIEQTVDKQEAVEPSGATRGSYVYTEAVDRFVIFGPRFANPGDEVLLTVTSSDGAEDVYELRWLIENSNPYVCANPYTILEQDKTSVRFIYHGGTILFEVWYKTYLGWTFGTEMHLYNAGNNNNPNPVNKIAVIKRADLMGYNIVAQYTPEAALDIRNHYKKDGQILRASFSLMDGVISEEFTFEPIDHMDSIVNEYPRFYEYPSYRKPGKINYNYVLEYYDEGETSKVHWGECNSIFRPDGTCHCVPMSLSVKIGGKYDSSTRKYLPLSDEEYEYLAQAIIDDYWAGIFLQERIMAESLEEMVERLKASYEYQDYVSVAEYVAHPDLIAERVYGCPEDIGLKRLAFFLDNFSDTYTLEHGFFLTNMPFPRPYGR